MATRSLGTLTLDLIAKIGGFTSGMDQASRVADKRMREIEKRAYAFGHGIGSSLKSAALEFVAFAGITVSVGKALESLKSAIDLADETRDLSIRLGESTQVISDFRYAAQQTGTDMDTLAKGLKILAKNAADAVNPTSQQAKVFEALGISVTDTAGNLKSLGTLVPEIADKFKGMADGTTKAATAQALFGKSGLDLTEFLNSGAQGLDDYAEKLRSLGGEITPEAAANADEFNDKLADLKTAFGGLALQVASDLLPDLKELVSDLVNMTREGGNAGSAAHDIAEGFRVVGSVAASTATLVGGITEAIAGFVQQVYGYVQLAGSLVTLNKQLRDNGFANIKGGSGKLQEAATNVALPHRRTGNIQYVESNLSLAPSASVEAAKFAEQLAAAKAAQAQQRKLQAALGNVTEPKAKTAHAKTGKSDAERQAEQVARAIEQMTKAQQDWEAEVSKTGNPIVDEYSDKLRQITEDGKNFAKDGVPADKVKAFTDQMTALATTVRDSQIVKFQQEFDDQTAEMAAHMQGPAAEALQTYREEVRKLDDLLKTGAITITEYNARLAQLGVARDSPMTDVSKSIQEQINLLGMTNDQQEIYNNLKAAGVDANSAWGQSIIANTDQLQKLREQTAFMDDVKTSLSDAFGDFITGAKTAKEAFGDFADHVYQTALRWLADKAIQALFNGFGKGSSTGATGGTGGGFDWGSLISSFFGGGKAGGGSVSPGKFYEVGEYNRPEMLMSGGKQYLIPGNAGAVTPLGAGAGGGMYAPTFNFNLPRRIDNRSEMQIAQRANEQGRMATRRNGR